MSRSRNRWMPGIVAAVAFLQGCAGAAISSSTYAAKASGRDALRVRADQGEAQAQYELGKLWCCMGPGFDTQTATQWLCRAALQGHPESLFELGRIYEGDISRTPAPGQKLLRMIRAEASPAHALAFYSLAADAGHSEAAARREALDREADSATRRHAGSLTADYDGSCEYESVFPARPGT